MEFQRLSEKLNFPVGHTPSDTGVESSLGYRRINHSSNNTVTIGYAGPKSK